MITQILLSKRLFLIGSEYADKTDPVSAGMAISLFQDAIEIFMWSLIKEFDAPAKDNTQFSAFFDLIANAPGNAERKEPPFKAKMLELNKARVNFKHYGNLPDHSEAVKFRAYAEQFLIGALSQFNGIDFSNVSIVDLVQINKVREFLKLAEDANREGDYKKAMEGVAVAKEILFERVEKLLPRIDRSALSDADRAFGTMPASRGGNVFRAIGDYLEKAQKFSILSILEIPFSEYLTIESHLPRVTTFEAGNMRFHPPRFHTPDKSHVEKAIQIIVNASLQAQKIL